MEIICPTCSKKVEKLSIEVEKARVNGRKIYCSRQCSNLGHTKWEFDPFAKCACCGKPLTENQQWEGNTYCSRSCSHRCRTHSDETKTCIKSSLQTYYIQHPETRVKIGAAIKAYNNAHPEAYALAHRGQREHMLSTGKVIQVDSEWEAGVYELLLKHCSLPWSYANEKAFFVGLGKGCNWLPDFVVEDFQGRKLLLEVKGHPKAVEHFEKDHYPLIKFSERCQRDFFVGLLTVAPWSLQLECFDDIMQALEWVIPPSEGLTSYIIGVHNTAPYWN